MAPRKPVPVVVFQLLFVFGAAHRAELSEEDLSEEFASGEVLEHGLKREDRLSHERRLHREHGLHSGEHGLSHERGLHGEDELGHERGLRREDGLHREGGLHGEQGLQGERGLGEEQGGLGGERGFRGETETANRRQNATEAGDEASARKAPDDGLESLFAEAAKFDVPARPVALLQETVEVEVGGGERPPAPPAPPSGAEGQPGPEHQPHGSAAAAAALPEESASAHQAHGHQASASGPPSLDDALKAALAAKGDGMCPDDGPFAGYGCAQPGCKCSWWPLYECRQPELADDLYVERKAAAFGQCALRWYLLALALLLPAACCCASGVLCCCRRSKTGGDLLGRRLSHEAPPADTTWMHRGGD